MSPPTLDRRRKSWTILFQDALFILTTNSGMLYALMDCWMMCAAVEVGTVYVSNNNDSVNKIVNDIYAYHDIGSFSL